MISTRRRDAARQTIFSVPPSGIAWQAFIARFSNACCSIPGSPLISGTLGGHSILSAIPRRSASGAVIDRTSLMSDDELHRLQLQLVRPRELQEPDHHLIEPRISSPMTLTCLVEIERLRAARRPGGHRRSARASPPSFCFRSSR